MAAQDLTKGKPSKTLLYFSIPLFVGNLFQQFYNIVDTVVVGQLIGSTAMAAVGTAGVVMNLVSSAGLGLASGCCVIVSQYLGARHYKSVRSSINTAICLFIGLGIIGTVAGLGIMRPLLTLLNTPEEYLTVIFFGILFVMLYNVLNQISAALGDSRTPMISLLAASLINVALDLWFTIQFGMGVYGVALATVIGQGAAALLSFLVIRRHIDRMNAETMEAAGQAEAGEAKLVRFDRELCGQMLRLGLPPLLQNVISSSGTMAVQGLLNSFGSTTAAAFTAANKIDGIAMTPMVSLGTAMAMYTGQNMGAGDHERVRAGYRFCNWFALGTCVVLGALIFAQSDFLLGLFVTDTATSELFAIGSEYLHVAVFSYFLMALMFITTGLLRGAGDVKTVFVCAMLDLGMRCLFAYGMVGFLARYGLWLSYPFGWAMSSALCIPEYFRGRWKKGRLVREEKTGGQTESGRRTGIAT